MAVSQTDGSMALTGSCACSGCKYCLFFLAIMRSSSQVSLHLPQREGHPQTVLYVDEERIAFTPAVELSYLNEQEQYDLLNAMEMNDCTPSFSQACRLKKMSQSGYLTRWDIAEIMSEEKANQKERLKIPMERVSKFFPSSYTPNQIEDEIVRICEERYRRRMSRDER